MFIWNTIRCCIRWWSGFLSVMCVTLLNLVLGNFQNATNQLKVMYLQHSSIPCVFNLHQCLRPFVLILRKICKHFIFKWVLLSLILAELLISFSNWRRNSQDCAMLGHCVCAEGRVFLYSLWIQKGLKQKLFQCLALEWAPSRAKDLYNCLYRCADKNRE